MNEAIFIFRVWFLKLVEISLSSMESFSRVFKRSDLICPTNSDVPLGAKFAMLVNTIGKFASEDPRCGVPRKRMPVTDFRIGSNNPSSVLAIISACFPVSKILHVGYVEYFFNYYSSHAMADDIRGRV